MQSMMKKAGLGIALAATTLAAAVPAEAQRYGRGFRGGYGRGNGALVAGVAGLAIGAAIASNNNRFRGGYYGPGPGYYGPGPGYYDRGFYGPGPGFYGPGPGFYDRGYYRGYQRCFVERRYDRYYGGPVRVRICR